MLLHAHVYIGICCPKPQFLIIQGFAFIVIQTVPQQNRGRKKIEWGEAIHIVNLCIVSYLNLISFQFLALYIYILILKSIKHLYPNLNKISRIRSKFKENGLRWSREFFFSPLPLLFLVLQYKDKLHGNLQFSLVLLPISSSKILQIRQK